MCVCMSDANFLFWVNPCERTVSSALQNIKGPKPFVAKTNNYTVSLSNQPRSDAAALRAALRNQNTQEEQKQDETGQKDKLWKSEVHSYTVEHFLLIMSVILKVSWIVLSDPVSFLKR